MRHAWWLCLSVFVGIVTVQPVWAGEVDILLDKLVQKGILTKAEAREVRGEVAEYKEAHTKQLAADIVPKWTQKLAWDGDIRLRYENIEKDGSVDRHRERIRLRLGLKGKISDQLEAGVRLATGTNLDPVSTNQSFQDIFDKKDLFVDQAYLKFTTKETSWEKSLPLTVWGGKFENPFYYTSLVWDGDLTPEGVAVSLTPTVGPVQAWVTGAIFPIDEFSGDANDPVLYGAQTGATWSVAQGAEEEWLKNLKLKAGIGYYDYAGLDGGLETTSSNRFGNTTHSSGSTATNTLLRYDFDEFNVLAEASTLAWGRPFKLYADFVKNTAVAKSDKGYQLGVKYGKADRPWAWEAGYFWQRLESDAVVGQFTDSDFGEGGANRDGHVYYAMLGTMKDSTLGVKWFVTEAVSGPTAANEEGSINRFQLDWVTKF